jgi:hypothetical protein
MRMHRQRQLASNVFEVCHVAHRPNSWKRSG